MRINLCTSVETPPEPGPTGPWCPGRCVWVWPPGRIYCCQLESRGTGRWCCWSDWQIVDFSPALTEIMTEVSVQQILEKYLGYLFSDLVNHQKTAAYTERRILAFNVGENDGDGGLLHRGSRCETGHKSGTAEVSQIEIERWQIYRGGLVTSLQVFRENVARKSNKIKYQRQ